MPLLLHGLSNSTYTSNYLTEPGISSHKAYTNDRSHWPSGKIIGDSVGVKALLYVRGNRFNYDS